MKGKLLLTASLILGAGLGIRGIVEDDGEFAFLLVLVGALIATVGSLLAIAMMAPREPHR